MSCCQSVMCAITNEKINFSNFINRIQNNKLYYHYTRTTKFRLACLLHPSEQLIITIINRQIIKIFLLPKEWLHRVMMMMMWWVYGWLWWGDGGKTLCYRSVLFAWWLKFKQRVTKWCCWPPSSDRWCKHLLGVGAPTPPHAVQSSPRSVAPSAQRPDISEVIITQCKRQCLMTSCNRFVQNKCERAM